MYAGPRELVSMSEAVQMYRVKAMKKENPVLRARPTHFFRFGRFFFFNLPKFCKIGCFFDQNFNILSEKMLKINQTICSRNFCKEVRLFARILCFKVIFAPEIKREVRPPVKQGFFFSSPSLRGIFLLINCKYNLLFLF